MNIGNLSFESIENNHASAPFADSSDVLFKDIPEEDRRELANTVHLSDAKKEHLPDLALSDEPSSLLDLLHKDDPFNRLNKLFRDDFKFFKSLDRNKDDELDYWERDLAIRDENVKGEEAEVLAILTLLWKPISELKNEDWGDPDDTISLKDMQKLKEIVTSRDREAAYGILDRIALINLQAEKRTGSAGVWGTEGICPEGVMQGPTGNCPVMSALAALAGSAGGQRQIRNMISQEPDGLYRVTFPGKDPIYVQPPTPAELALFGSDSQKYGSWSVLIQKAAGLLLMAATEERYEELTGVEKPVRLLRNNNRNQPDRMEPGLVPILFAGEGSTRHFGIELLTGKEAARIETSHLGVEVLASALEEALSQGRLVTAGTPSPWLFAQSNLISRAEELGLPMQHENSILGFDRQTGMIKIRNPWGRQESNQSTDGKDDGTWEMPLQDFLNCFSLIAIQEP